MKIFSILTIALLIIFQTVGFAETKTFSASGEYLMSDYDTPEIAEEIALDFAKQNAAEQAGIYLESYSRSANFNLEADEIKTVASSKVEVIEKNISRQSQANNRILLRADIKATVDTAELDNFIAQEREQRRAAIQRYKELQNTNGKIKQDIGILQAKLAAIKDDVKDDDLLVEQERINREFLAKKKAEEFKNQFIKSKGSSLDITLLEDAIKLQPKLYWLYPEYGGFKRNIRIEKMGLALLIPGNTSRLTNSAIKEINKAIILAPEEPFIYMERGILYATVGKLDKALADYDKAMQLEPKNAYSYVNRGNFYLHFFNDYGKAFADYNKAIELDPKNNYAYNSRGLAYEFLGDLDKALADYDKALEFDSDNELIKEFTQNNRQRVLNKMKK